MNFCVCGKFYFDMRLNVALKSTLQLSFVRHWLIAVSSKYYDINVLWSAADIDPKSHVL